MKTSPTAPLNLERYRDRQRVVVAYLPAAAREPNETFHQRWANAAGELKERDAVWIEIDDLHRQPADLVRRLGFTEGRFGLALVGKDGHVAWQSSEPTAPQAIFDQIDAMPMRQREMRERAAHK
ncbi:MAG: DUF4174 domain-containing protein [Verrucomicrobia bacterium]|nr:DUF4174 domain-containing protein [Verrucomicrobiota bacterium]